MNATRIFLITSLVGLSAFGAESARAEPFAYVPDAIADVVTVIDTGTNAVVDAIGVGSNPQAIAVSPVGNRAYVVNAGDDTVSVIDTAANEVVDTIAIANLDVPTGIVVTPDGSRIFVIRSSVIVPVDTATGSVGSVIPVGPGPVDLVMHPDGSRLYVANQTGASISVIDVAANAVVDTIAPVAGPHALAISPDGSRLFVSDFVTESLRTIDTASNEVVVGFPVDAPTGLAVSPDGAYVYVGSVFDSVEVFDAATGFATGTLISLTESPDKLVAALTAHGPRIYVTHLAGINALSVINAATNSLVDSVPVGTGTVAVTVGPAPDVTAVRTDPSNPLTVYAATAGAGVFISNDGGTTWAAANGGLAHFDVTCLAIAPDGSAVYAGTESGGVFRTSDGGGTWQAVSNGLGNLHVLSLHVVPGNGQVLYAGLAAGGGVYKSVDGGSTWAAAMP